VNSSEPCIAAAGCEDVRARALWEFFETAEDVVANASVQVLALVLGSVCNRRMLTLT
jgi:hypothetical protein